MTKEELKQEAEKSLDKRLGTYAYIRKQDCYTNYVDGYIDSAEPREKRIAELEEKLANADYQLEGRDNEIRELEAQIEKMKCCGNCAKNGHICVAEEMQGKLCGKNKDKWELRR
jgi:chromosome segregation ATPase